MQTITLILIVLCSGVSLIALLTVIDLLLPAPVERARLRLEASIGRCFWTGLINLVFWLIVLALFIVWTQANSAPQAVLVSVALVLLVFVLVTVIVPGLPALSAIARLLGTRMGKSRTGWQVDLAGGLLLILACLTPYLGWFIFTPAILSIAMGSGLLATFQRKTARTPKNEERVL